jgi:hypothetical protein
MSTLRHRANLVLCGFTAVLPLRAQSYQTTDLKVLPGELQSVACGVQRACSLNSLGQAAGTSSNPTAAIATLLNDGKTTNLNTLGAEVSAPSLSITQAKLWDISTTRLPTCLRSIVPER